MVAINYATYFKAFGTMGDSNDMRMGGSPSILREDIEEQAAPAAFYSNQSGILGKVKWEGRVSLDTIIAELNEHLQYLGEENKGFDFREVYRHWEYRYQVVRFVGKEQTIEVEKFDSQ